MKYIISGPIKPTQGTIYIPSSKSISNRMLVIRSLAGSDVAIDNLSDSDDTLVLLKALEERAIVKDVGHAGTAMRFLAAYFATRSKEVILTGSERMKERPMGPLVEALRMLGARIDYMEKEGCPPLKISGGLSKGGSITIDGGISSQFISALMMVGPLLEGGLHITLAGEVVSATYIEMTLALMNMCGIGGTFDGQQIVIPHRSYTMEPFKVESDWSGASYWYQAVSFSPGSEIFLPLLSDEGLQGDSELAQIFEPLGVMSLFGDKGVTLKAEERSKPGHIRHDFTGCPDLVQTCAVTLCALDVPFRFSGTRTLRVKETDRIAALQAELGKLGFVIESDKGGEWISWDRTRCEPEQDPVIQTYHDHRMAMAFAPLAKPIGSITIEDPMVVTKSYPGFWKDMEKAGFTISPV